MSTALSSQNDPDKLSEAIIFYLIKHPKIDLKKEERKDHQKFLLINLRKKEKI